MRGTVGKGTKPKGLRTEAQNKNAAVVIIALLSCAGAKPI